MYARNALFSRFLCALCAVMLTLACVGSGAENALAAGKKRKPGPVQVRSAILVDAATGKVLYEQNADAGIPPASLTKVLSMYVAMDAISSGKIRLNDTVKVSRQAARQGGSRMFLKAGDRVTVERLLFGMAISSGNDASVAVAEKVAGSSSKFVALMNKKAASLGLKKTTFRNVHGLPAKGQMTTARDMAKIAVAYLKRYPDALKYHRTMALRHNGVLTTNKNPLLRKYNGADGLKTGWITASGYNIVTTAKRDGKRLIAVVLGAPNSATRAREVRKLMDAGFDSLAQKKTVATVLGVKKSKPARLAADTPKTDKPKQQASRNTVKKQKKSTQTATQTKRRDTTVQATQTQNSKNQTKSRSRASSSSRGWTSSGSLMDS